MAPKVELWVSGAWLDISSYVLARDGSFNIGISRGEPNEGARTEPARATMHLNNRDSRFSPRNPLSPLFGQLGRNQPIRISVPSGLGTSYRLVGEVPAWPQKSDTSGSDVWVELEAAGPLRRLGQGNAPIGSAMYVAIAGGVTANTVIAYWPCQDPSGSTVISSAVSGVTAMTITGTPVLATNSDFACSTALPTMGDASFTSLVPYYIPPGGLSTSNPFSTLLRFLLEIPAGGATDGQVVAAMTWTGTTPRWEVYYSAASGGKLGLRGRDTTGTVVQDTGTGGPALNGVPVHVTASWDEAGGIDLEYGLSILPVGSTSPSGPATFTAGPATGTVQSVTIAPGRGLAGTVIGHVSVQVCPSYPTDAAAVAGAAAAWVGETAADRISRLCGVAGVTYEMIGSAADTVLMGAQSSATLMDLIWQAVDADGGLLYESVSTLGLGYRTRVSMENQAASLALSYSAHQLAQLPVPLDDDQYTRNDVTVTRQGGGSARATLTTGALSTQAPPNGVGPYPDTPSINVQSDSSLADQAGWRLHLGTVDEPRYPQLSVNLAHPSMAALQAAALGVRPGDRITVGNLPSNFPPGDISQLALGTSETIDAFQHRITYNGRPESPYRIAVTDDAVLGRADTDGSQLAANVNSTATTLSVSITSGPLWTTAAGDFPFDVQLGGETVTVTNITGSTSPQSFTVVRSVNGVVKSQTSGTDIRLAQPSIIAL